MDARWQPAFPKGRIPKGREILQHEQFCSVERLAGSNFDAIRMGCQMPLMDGDEVAGRIRGMEKELHLGSRRVSVVSVTANGLKKERVLPRCWHGQVHLKAFRREFPRDPEC
jgi:CheY-like chemotaxis protein